MKECSNKPISAVFIFLKLSSHIVCLSHTYTRTHTYTQWQGETNSLKNYKYNWFLFSYLRFSQNKSHVTLYEVKGNINIIKDVLKL